MSHNNDMIKLVKLFEGKQEFAGEEVGQKPGDQVRGTDKAETKGTDHPFKGRLVGEDTTLEDVLSKKYQDFKDIQAKKDSGASQEQETEFHKKLDTLVHKTFGKRKNESEQVDEISYPKGYLPKAERSLSTARATQRTFGASPEDKAKAERTIKNRERGMMGYGKRHRAAHPEMYPTITPRPAPKLRDPSTEYSDDYTTWARGRRDTMEQGVAEGLNANNPQVGQLYIVSDYGNGVWNGPYASYDEARRDWDRLSGQGQDEYFIGKWDGKNFQTADEQGVAEGSEQDLQSQMWELGKKYNSMPNGPEKEAVKQQYFAIKKQIDQQKGTWGVTAQTAPRSWTQQGVAEDSFTHQPRLDQRNAVEQVALHNRQQDYFNQFVEWSGKPMKDIYNDNDNHELAYKLENLGKQIAGNWRNQQYYKPGSPDREKFYATMKQWYDLYNSAYDKFTKEQGVAEGWKEKAASAALAGSMALGGPAHAGKFGDSVAQGLGAGMTSAAISSVSDKKRNARDEEFGKQIPDEEDRATYLKAFKRIKHSRALRFSDPSMMGANAVTEINFKKLKQEMAKKYNIPMPVKEQGVAEGTDNYSPVTNAITRRIMLQRHDLLSKYGVEKVSNAIDEVADYVGDTIGSDDEIGSSDVSGWVRHVEQLLGNMEESAQLTELGATPTVVTPNTPAAPKAPTGPGTANAAPTSGSVSPDEQTALNKINQNPAMKQQFDKLMGQAQPTKPGTPMALDPAKQDALEKLKANAGLKTQYDKLIQQANPQAKV